MYSTDEDIILNKNTYIRRYADFVYKVELDVNEDIVFEYDASQDFTYTITDFC